MTVNNSLASFAKVISSLDKIPEKLQCPACSKFLLNGYRVPCCEQCICETCFSTISDHCPVCDHRPITQELCKPNKAVRNTAKAFLKTAEKRLADERAKTEPFKGIELETPGPSGVEGRNGTETKDDATRETGQDATLDKVESAPTVEQVVGAQLQLSVETSSIKKGGASITQQVDKTINSPTDPVLPLREDATNDASQQLGNGEPTSLSTDLEQASGQPKVDVNGVPNGINIGVNTGGFPNMMNMNMGTGFNNMDYSQVMQLMGSNGMGNINGMMGMPNMANMGIGSMSQGLFGGFGGPGGMAGMNGINGMNMNMGMNFNPAQGMYGTAWNVRSSNMWNGLQNNNPNAFSNGIGGDYGSNSGFGYNMSQQGNFHQQQYPNGEIQNGFYARGYGRGRGRGRGGYGRGRGGYAPNTQGNFPNFQQPHEQQQYEIQAMQAEMMKNQASQEKPSTEVDSKRDAKEEQIKALNDEFAPGGQEDVHEALGDDYARAQREEREPSAIQSVVREQIDSANVEAEPVESTELTEVPVTIERDPEGDSWLNDDVEMMQASQNPLPPISEKKALVSPREKSPENGRQPTPQASMPPPSAPLGPASHFDPTRDYGFRGRGHGRYSSRGRGSLHLPNGSTFSPVKPAPEPPFNPPTEPKRPGVVGAPTGPKAMRAGPAPPTGPARGRGGGFQIVGRARMDSQGGQSRVSEYSRSVTPLSAQHRARSSSQSPSRRRSRHHHHHKDSRHETESEDERERRHERQRRRSKREDRDDHEAQDRLRDHSRSTTPEEPRKSSRRGERDKEVRSSTKHRSSHRSRHHRDDDYSDDDYEMDDYDSKAKSSRDAVETESRGSHHMQKSSKASRYDDKDRDDRHRERKRSRRDRDDKEDDDEESRHRSRRHKREHKEDHVNGSGRERRSEKPIPTFTPTEPEKDPHTLEREARNQERMLKEQQRREKAENADQGPKRRMAGGRRVSYKYEDEAQATMVEQERRAARWR